MPTDTQIVRDGITAKMVLQILGGMALPVIGSILLMLIGWNLKQVMERLDGQEVKTNSICIDVTTLKVEARLSNDFIKEIRQDIKEIKQDIKRCDIKYPAP